MLIASRLSAIRFVTDVIRYLNTNRTGTMEVLYQDWDAHADLQEMPNADLIGMNGFAITDQDRTHEIVFGVTICTYNDPNVFRLTEFSNEFYKRMRTHKQFPLFDPETASPIGVATFESGTTVTPVARVEVRPTMSISCSALIVMNSEFSDF